jgi:hypothetical protein
MAYSHELCELLALLSEFPAEAGVESNQGGAYFEP